MAEGRKRNAGERARKGNISQYDEFGDAGPAGREVVGKKDYELLAAFRHTLRQFLSFSENAAEAFGVTPQQYQALLVIVGFPGRDRATVGELASRLLLKHHSAVGLANRLSTRKLIVREADPADRRVVWLRIAPRGAAILQRLAAAHRAELRRLTPAMHRSLQRLTRDAAPASRHMKEAS